MTDKEMVSACHSKEIMPACQGVFAMIGYKKTEYKKNLTNVDRAAYTIMVGGNMI